jgi:hypothetical protein
MVTSHDMEAARGTLAMPDRLASPWGELSFFDGVPTPESTDTLYDVLDLNRAIEVFLNMLPGASLVAMRNGFRSVGLEGNSTLGVISRGNSGSFFLTANTETTYGAMFFDLREGPIVVEAPPRSLCVVDDFWFRYVADLGIAGPDQGAGGRYCFLPPDHPDEPVPDGYYVYRTSTYTNWLIVRALGGRPDIEKTRIYPLAQADDPPPTTYLDLADLRQNTIHANDASFYHEVHTVLSEEPPESLDPERAGQCAAIGLVHGKPFEPDERLRRILGQAAPLAAGIARALSYRPRDPASYYYEGSNWINGFPSGSYEFLRDQARLLDARATFHYVATVITPAMAAAKPGAGSAYALATMDSAGECFDGARSYRLTLPPNIPAKNFWSVDLYDTQTRSLLEVDDPHPSVMSLSPDVTKNDDGSVDLWFGPEAPAGHETNWVQTAPGKSWFAILRLYGPLEAWFDKTWRPGEIEPV